MYMYRYMYIPTSRGTTSSTSQKIQIKCRSNLVGGQVASLLSPPGFLIIYIYIYICIYVCIYICIGVCTYRLLGGRHCPLRPKDPD